jgi:hypothetical protein
VSVGDKPFALSSACDLTQPLIFINARARNTGITATSGGTVVARTDTGAFEGSQTLPSLGAGAAADIQIKLRHVASSTAPIGVTHAISLLLGPRTLTTLSIAVPAKLCEGVALGPAPAPGAYMTKRHMDVLAAPATPTARPRPIGDLVAKGGFKTVPPLFNVPPPYDMSVTLASDCKAIGDPGTFGPCFAILKKAGVVFSWAWTDKGTGFDTSAAYAAYGAWVGFRLYRVDGGRKSLEETAYDKATTWEHLRGSRNIKGRCYAVAAFLANGGPESALSQAACVPADWEPPFESS